jgi:hypoxanthine phosphoribosyltransferase
VTPEVKFEAPSWKKIYDILLDLAGRIRKDGFKPDVIVGISRGGWPPARVMSDLLSNPNVANVRAEFYLGITETNFEPVLTQPVSMNIENKRILIVDEVADTGKSLRMVKDHVIRQGAKEARTVTVYCKPWSTVKPDYFGRETANWIVLPWEIKETLGKIMVKCKEREKLLKRETAKLVKAGIPARLIRQFLKEILEENER